MAINICLPMFNMLHEFTFLDLAWKTISKSETSPGVQQITSKKSKIVNPFMPKCYISEGTGLRSFVKHPNIAHIHIHVAFCCTGKFIFEH